MKTFKRGSGCYVCRDCGKQTRETGGGESASRLCRDCYTLAEWANAHSDESHDETPDPNCPICRRK